MKSPKPKAVKREQKRIIESIIEDENLPTESQNDDFVLNQYINTAEPSQKRFKEDYDIEDGSDDERNGSGESIAPKEPTTPKRNPFKTSSTIKDELLSPTRISKENNSLIKNQSPVKKIDFGKLQKLSRFNRTVIPNKQNIISKFFNATTKEESAQQATIQTKTESCVQDTKLSSNLTQQNESVQLNGEEPDPIVQKTEANAQMKSPNLLDAKAQLPKLYFTKSTDSGISTNTDNSPNQSSENEPGEDKDFSHDNQRSILNKFKYAIKGQIGEHDAPEAMDCDESSETSNKTDNDTNDLPINLSDNENETDSSQSATAAVSTQRMWLNAQNSKAVSRTNKIGLISY